MSELEKTPLAEVGATPAAETPAAVNPETVETEAPAEETSAEVTIEESTPEGAVADGDESPVWHTMTKQELVDALKSIVEGNEMQRNKDVSAIKQAFHALHTRELERMAIEFAEAGNDPAAFIPQPDELEYQMKELLARFKEGRADFLAKEQERLEENLKGKREVIEQLKNIADDIDNINLHYPKFLELQTRFKEINDVPPSAENEVWKEFQSIVEMFYDRLKVNKELRDLDFKKNLEKKREFIEKAKALADVADVVSASRQLQELHAKWRETGPVAKEYRESIWEEFSAASTVVNKRHQAYFEERKAAEKANEEAKTQLCEEIEALDYQNLDSFNKWEAMTKQVLELQQRWKALGFASKKVNNLLFARFRKTCDEFFAAKADYYKRVKEELAANLQKKTALCEQVEALLEQEDRNKNAEKVIALQAEWKTIGGVARRQSDAIWQRFTTACNKFFEDRKRQNSAVRKEETDNLAAKRDIIEQLKGIDVEKMDRSEGIAATKELQAKWQSTGHVPYKLKDKLYDEYRAECDRIYNGYDYSSKRRNRADFENRIESMASGDAKLSRERDRLYRAYEAKRAELKTYENNMGFFNVKSKGGNSMVREMEKKIERIKADLADLKRKIELIDEKMD